MAPDSCVEGGHDTHTHTHTHAHTSFNSSDVPQLMGRNPFSSKQTSGNQKQSGAKNNRNICSSRGGRARGEEGISNTPGSSQTDGLSPPSLSLTHTHTQPCSDTHSHLLPHMRRRAWEGIRHRNVCLKKKKKITKWR